MWKDAIHHLMKFSLTIFFFWMTVAFWSLWESSEWNFHSATGWSAARDVSSHNAVPLCQKPLSLKEETWLLQNDAAYFVQALHSYSHIAYRQPWSSMTCIFQTILHAPKGSTSKKCFFVLLHGFRSNGSLPCEGGSAHTCTNIIFKEHNKRLT